MVFNKRNLVCLIIWKILFGMTHLQLIIFHFSKCGSAWVKCENSATTTEVFTMEIQKVFHNRCLYPTTQNAIQNTYCMYRILRIQN